MRFSPSREITALRTVVSSAGHGRAAADARAEAQAQHHHADFGVASTVAAERAARDDKLPPTGESESEGEGITFREVTSTPQTRSCPRCHELLVPTSFADDIEVDRCLSCRGIWLDFGELATMQRSAVAQLIRDLAASGRRRR